MMDARWCSAWGSRRTLADVRAAWLARAGPPAPRAPGGMAEASQDDLQPARREPEQAVERARDPFAAGRLGEGEVVGRDRAVHDRPGRLIEIVEERLHCLVRAQHLGAKTRDAALPRRRGERGHEERAEP